MASARFILCLSLALSAAGCQWRSMQKVARVVDPALPMSISRDELVEHLNRQQNGLQCWRCKNTRIQISMPGIPMPQKLSGSLACSAPGQFRLVADGALVVHTDFGANDELCWAYVKPGDPAVLTWKHEDSYLLQHLSGGLPRLEPKWLMTILGVQPLNPEDYELQNAPEGSRELWLVAIEDAPDGSSLRRVIKVDSVTGMAREHALYDSDRNPLIRAQLSNHRSCQGHVIPHSVRLTFPMHETVLTLNFSGIETECQIADSLWRPPRGPGLHYVDLGDHIREQLQNRDPQARYLTQPQHPLPDGSETARLESGAPVFDLPGEPEELGPGDADRFGQLDSAIRPVTSTHTDESDAEPPQFDIASPPPQKRRSWFPNWK